MTKQKAIRELGKLGWQFLRNDGKFMVVFNPPICETYPEGWTKWGGTKAREVIADPRDLLEEVLARS